MSELLLKEKTLPLSQLSFPTRKKLQGVLRIIDKEGETFGLFLDKKAIADFSEDIEYSSPEFWEEIEKSKKSGEVSSKQIKRRLKI